MIHSLMNISKCYSTQNDSDICWEVQSILAKMPYVSANFTVEESLVERG
jgi:hypothetical protein